MRIYEFWTPTSIPTEAFTVMGLSAKPNSASPIGQFGTGLKLSIATVLRKGGSMSLHVDGTEYVFYTKSREFRGSDYRQVMMRKRKGMLARFSYHELPFTLNYGRNLDAWQVYRELESNTRDEGGQSFWVEDDPIRPEGTTIRVTLAGLKEAVYSEAVFFDAPAYEKSWGTSDFDVYDVPSKHLYFKGVRVFSLKEPSRFTYNFKASCTLTEDRTPNNVWYMMHLIQQAWMTVNIKPGVIEKALSFKPDSAPLFETHELTFDATAYGVTDTFKSVAEKLGRIKRSSPKLLSWGSGRSQHVAASLNITRTFTPGEAKEIAKILREAGRSDLAGKFVSEPETHDEVPF